MTVTDTHCGRALQELGCHRRALAGRSPQLLAEVYLGHLCNQPFSSMHEILFQELVRLVERRAGRLAVAAPRGHAKSTIVSLAFVLWCLLYEKEKLVLLVSATREQAVTLLKHIKDELTRNALLRQDFPGLCRMDGGPGSGRQARPWRDNRIFLSNGSMVCAYGAYQGLRGARNGPHRPGLIIADDIENPESVISEDQRTKLKQWFTSTLLHAGDTATNVVAVGTILHQSSLLADLTNPRRTSGWRHHRFRAVISFAERAELWEQWQQIFRGDREYQGQSAQEAARAFYEANAESMLEGTEVLWPQHENYYDLMLMREREGRASFQAEKQNEPLDPELCIFSDAIIRCWEDEFPDEQSLVQSLEREHCLRFYGACDPSLGSRTGKGDYSAIIVLAQDYKAKVNYVIVADIARRSPDQTIERILQYAQMYDFNRFGVESNHFQELMVDNLERRARTNGMRLHVNKIESRTNKQSRIANLEPEIAQGRIRFNRRHTLLLEQLKSFPVGAHDDGPDALEMAVATSQRPRYRVRITDR